MDKLNNLQDLFVHELKDLYSAEQQILQALPKMAAATAHEELRTAFEEHTEMTREQVVLYEAFVRDSMRRIEELPAMIDRTVVHRAEKDGLL